MSTQQNQTEFYSPFVHIPGRYEFCRIHSPSHGSFDTFIFIETTTDKPVTVYVNSEKGAGFMEERYPESRCFRVESENLDITSDKSGREVHGKLTAEQGPVSSINLIFKADAQSNPVESPYGNKKFLVWGSSWTCVGMDLDLEAYVKGTIKLSNGSVEEINSSAILTLGSSGLIEKV